MTAGLPLIGEKSDNHLNENQHRFLARIVHSLLCMVIGTYLLCHYHAATGPIVLLLSGALIAEWLPWKWRRWFIPECCLLVISLISYGWTVAIDDGLGGFRSVLNPSYAFAGWIRMTLIFWALVPSRQHMIKAVAGMTAGELILIANSPDIHLALIGTLVGVTILSLFFETWLSHGYSAQDQVQIHINSKRKPWTFAFVTTFVIIFSSLSLGVASKSLTTETIQSGTSQNSDDTNNESTRHLSTTIGLDESSFTDQDPTIAARISWDDPGSIPQGMFYLRALTVPELYLADTSIRWRSSPTITAVFSDLPKLSTDQLRNQATLFRQRGSGDLVLRPDHTREVGLFNMKSDRDGNLFRTGIGEFPRKYQVDLGTETSPPPSFELPNRDRNLFLPISIRNWVTEEIPEIQRWRRMKPSMAGQSISRWIRRRTRYSTHDLPAPTEQPGGSLRTFLFGTPAERQGHCQFYSSASTILMRASGHQARPVLGFASDEYDAEGISFRALHAHAWTEFKTEDGAWQRLDATPGNALAQRSSGIPVDPDETFDSIDFDETEEPKESGSMIWVLSVILGLVTLIGLALCAWWKIGPGHGREKPETRQLRRSTNALLACAQDCGIPVQVSSTLTDVASELERVSGIDLQQQLEQHLQARFGEGAQPPEWPIRAIKQSYTQRKNQRVAR